MPCAAQIGTRTRMRSPGFVSRSPRWSVNYIAPDDASPLNEPGEKPSVCVLPARKGQTHSALASYVGSLFPETNCEFVQSYECEGRRSELRGGCCPVCGAGYVVPVVVN